MSHMIRDWVYGSPILWLPVLALLLFIGFFAAMALRLKLRGAARYEPLARLPLEDDDGRA